VELQQLVKEARDPLEFGRVLVAIVGEPRAVRDGALGDTGPPAVPAKTNANVGARARHREHFFELEK
jgi:hypothetical protein